jgi:hypothetical protein
MENSSGLGLFNFVLRNSVDLFLDSFGQFKRHTNLGDTSAGIPLSVGLFENDHCNYHIVGRF